MSVTLEYELLEASQYGDLEYVNALISQGADVNTSDEDGDTPLHLACDYGHVEIVKALIKTGADVNAKEWGGGSTPLHCAVRAKSLEIVEVLLESGADVNAIEWIGEGCTPLHLAAFDKLVEIAELLIKHGADIESKDDRGNTPFDIAYTYAPDGDMFSLLEYRANNVDLTEYKQQN